MPDNAPPPHDRGKQLWDASEGPSRMLISSIDRWTSALLADDGIDMPFMGGSENVEATIIAKDSGILAGCAAVDHMLQIWAGGLQISWSHGEGRSISSGDEIATIRGDKDAILGMERTILNILGQLSGIATEAKKWSSIAPKQIACTRKTIWGLLDKWAVVHLGGGLTHRLSKQDAKMIKENDLAVMYPELDSNGARISKYLSEVNPSECGAFLEVEVREEKEAIMAAFTWSERRMIDGHDRLVIMLDNFTPERCKAVADELTEMSLREHVVLEASGGIVLDSLEDWRECGLDVLSTSTINRGTSPLDLSMLMNEN
ncbi:MAG: nicotinate-nucleotide pyrophosphorylase [Methanobacteriota archaeon]|nr:MAG: nicotinate-nucleotide pyrophosphorylase [Euryarchaeota archaeon]